jgi:hypothetical protein
MKTTDPKSLTWLPTDASAGQGAPIPTSLLVKAFASADGTKVEVHEALVTRDGTRLYFWNYDLAAMKCNNAGRRHDVLDAELTEAAADWVREKRLAGAEVVDFDEKGYAVMRELMAA